MSVSLGKTARVVDSKPGRPACYVVHCALQLLVSLLSSSHSTFDRMAQKHILLTSSKSMCCTTVSVIIQDVGELLPNTIHAVVPPLNDTQRVIIVGEKPIGKPDCSSWLWRLTRQIRISCSYSHTATMVFTVGLAQGVGNSV